METSLSLTWLGVPDSEGTWGLQQKTPDLESVGGDTTGEPRRADLTEAGGPSTLSKVVAVSVVQGVEQAGAEVAGERAGHILCRKHTVAASICNQRPVHFATGKPGFGSSNPRQRSTTIDNVWAPGQCCNWGPWPRAGIRGRRTSAEGPKHINEGCHVKGGGDINFVSVRGRVGGTNRGGG
jgi:hypothetical protein